MKTAFWVLWTVFQDGKEIENKSRCYAYEEPRMAEADALEFAHKLAMRDAVDISVFEQKEGRVLLSISCRS